MEQYWEQFKGAYKHTLIFRQCQIAHRNSSKPISGVSWKIHVAAERAITVKLRLTRNYQKMAGELMLQ